MPSFVHYFHCAHFLARAEPLGKGNLIVTDHILAGNHDHKVVQPNLADIIHRRIIQAAAKIDP